MSENVVHMVYADENGQIFDHPNLLMVGSSGGRPATVPQHELVPVPRGSDLFILPGRRPVGLNPDTGELETMEGPYVAVSTFLAPAWVRLRHPVYEAGDNAPILPLYAYAAMGYSGGQFWTAAGRVDAEDRQDPWLFDENEIEKLANERRQESPDNRLVSQVHRCATEYGCRAAQNYFLGRYEAPLPTSEGCNAACIGCISLQPIGSCEAAHERVVKHPEAEEIAEVACEHIKRVDRAVVSFGQGCEGEPLLRADVLYESIQLIRERTPNGTIHLNSNASIPEAVDRLCQAGLQSMPRGYTFADVRESGRTVKRHGGFLSLNLLVFPGLNDMEAELTALEEFIAEVGVDMIQMRNLNIDPERYEAILGPGKCGDGIGLVAMMERLRAKFPALRFGYFNPPHQTFGDEPGQIIVNA